MKNKVALVTDLKVVDSPQAGLGVAQCLKDAGFEIIGVDNTPFITANSDIFVKTFCWPEISTLNFDALIKKIVDIKKIYGLDFIFPCYDETVVLFSFMKDKIGFLGSKLVAPGIDTLRGIQKANLHNLIARCANSYKTPPTKLVNSVKEAIDFAEKISYPVICKGVVKGAYFCKNEADVKYNIQKIADIWNNGEIKCLVRKYIEGQHKNCVVAIKNNKIVGYVEMLKLGLDQNGATWFGKIEKSKALLKLAEYITKSLSFDMSIIEIETIKNNDGYFIYEINPRSPGWIYAPCQLGLNLPALVVGNSNNQIEFVRKEGYFGRESKDFIRNLGDIKDFEDNFRFYSKAAAYKNKNLKYPSELL